LIDSSEIARRALKLAELKRIQRMRRRKKTSLVVCVCGIVVVAAIATMLTMYQQSVEIEDAPIPLASPGSLIMNNSESIMVPADSREMKIPLENPENSSYCYIFELVLVDTEEVLYVSEPIPPGETIGSFNMARTLERGEHTVLLNIRAYELNGSDELYVTSKTINLSVN